MSTPQEENTAVNANEPTGHTTGDNHPTPATDRVNALLLRDDTSSSDDNDNDVAQVANPTGASAQSVDADPKTPSPSATQQPNSGTSKRKRGAASTARKKTSAAKQKSRITRGSRVKVTRADLYHILKTGAQKATIEPLGNNCNIYGRVKVGSSQKGWTIEFDLLPADEKAVLVMRKKIRIVAEGDEEPEFDHVSQFDATKPAAKKKKEAPMAKSAREFCALDDEELEAAKQYVMRWGDGPTDEIVWEILPDNEHLTDLPIPPVPEKANFTLTWEQAVSSHQDSSSTLSASASPRLDLIFFDHFFPSVKGHGKIMDDYFDNRNALMYITVQREKIKFHDATAEDPDWLVRKCYLLLIAAASEVENGVENLWKRGPSGGRREYPDFGQYAPINTFKAFRISAPMCWCHKIHWYKDKRDRPWVIFEECLASFNQKRSNLVRSALLMLDESMSGWRPKTSRLGGLPNYTFEPRKPILLGTMLRNGVECTSGVLVFQDIVQPPEVQARKAYQGVVSSLPNQPDIVAHTAEVLRQVEGAGLEEGGWVGGDAWFGSMMSTVETKIRLKVDSTWIIKNNQTYYPMRALHAVLSARHGTRPAGHWVVFRTEISGVKLFALCYAWSQRGISYFLSTCGSTKASPRPYLTHFEDEFGGVQYKEIPRPEICEFLYEFLPLIDEHNKQRQSLLNLEKSWPTKDCWFRLLTTLLGMSCVDFHRWYRHEKLNQSGFSETEETEVGIVKFSDKICSAITSRVAYRPRINLYSSEEEMLERITDESGEKRRAVTDKEREKGRKSGCAKRQNCWICRKYLNPDGGTTYQVTSWRCKACGMPLCKDDRSGVNAPCGGRQMSCGLEHTTTNDRLVGCSNAYSTRDHFPKDKQVNLNPRRAARRRGTL
jgi:hypothetical protein